jgi:hypothetical protein
MTMKRVLAIAAAVLALTAAQAAADTGTGLVGYWQLDEGSGTAAADISGYGNNGTVLGSAAWVPGRFGTGLSFAGESDSVYIPNNSSLEPSAVSVSAWVNHAGSPGNYSYIVAKGASGCMAASFAVYSGPGGGLEFYVSKKRGTIYARSPDAGTGVWDGNWHLVVGTFDDTRVRLFVDGSEVGSGTPAPGLLEYLLPDSNDLFIGNYPGCRAHQFVGVIDDVMAWNRALAPADVTELAAQSGGSSPPAIGQTATSSGQPATGPGTQPGSDPPALRRLRIWPSAFAIGTSQRAVAINRRTGATISYRDTQAARSTFTIRLAQPGVLKGALCMKPSRRGRSTHRVQCSRYVALGSFTHADRAGRNRFQFAGLSGRKLAPGRYRLDATPTAHDQTGRTVSAVFTVIR